MNWLEKLFPPAAQRRKINLPSLDVRSAGLPSLFTEGFQGGKGGRLPNASLIYGVGAGMLMAFVLYFLFTGAWLTSLLILVPACALFGFALLYLRHFG